MFHPRFCPTQEPHKHPVQVHTRSELTESSNRKRLRQSIDMSQPHETDTKKEGDQPSEQPNIIKERQKKRQKLDLSGK